MRKYLLLSIVFASSVFAAGTIDRTNAPWERGESSPLRSSYDRSTVGGEQYENLIDSNDIESNKADGTDADDDHCYKSDGSGGTVWEVCGSSGDAVDGVSYDGATGILSLSRTTGDDLTANINEILLPDANGNLPDPDLNQERIAVSGNHILQSTDHGAVGLDVEFKRYGSTRVVLTGEPARTSQEDNFQGAFNVPPDISVYDASDFLWDRGSQIWLFKQNANDVTWRGFGGPAGFAHGSLYATEALAETHVSEAGKVFIIGQGSGQHVFIVTSYTAATDENWQWDIIGLTQGDLQSAITSHNAATDSHDDIRTEINTDVTAHDGSGTAHNSIRSLVSANDDRLDALDPVEIEAYDSTATYSRGSANSIVTHSNGLFIYISSTERSSGHDPDNQPGYWLKLSEGMAYEVITSGSHRIAARTIIVDGNNDNVYLCTTTQTTPRDLSYIAAQAASIGGAFILLNGGGSGGTTVTANPTGTDGDNLERITIDGTNYNLPEPMGGGLTAVTSDATLSGSGTSGSPISVANPFTDADETKLDGIETGATADQTSTEIVTGLEALSGNARLDYGALKDTPSIPSGDVTGIDAGTGIRIDDANTATPEVNIADGGVNSDQLAANAAGDGKVPIDNTLDFDGSGNLGVQISTVIDLLDEDIRYYSTDTTREDAHQASKGIVFLDTSRYAKRIHSVEWDFEGDGVGHNYTTFFVRIDSSDDIDFVYGESETLFNVGTSGTPPGSISIQVACAYLVA